MNLTKNTKHFPPKVFPLPPRSKSGGLITAPAPDRPQSRLLKVTSRQLCDLRTRSVYLEPLPHLMSRSGSRWRLVMFLHHLHHLDAQGHRETEEVCLVWPRESVTLSHHRRPRKSYCQPWCIAVNCRPSLIIAT